MFRTFGCLAAFADTGGLGLFSGLLALGRRSAELAFFPDPCRARHGDFVAQRRRVR